MIPWHPTKVYNDIQYHSCFFVLSDNDGESGKNGMIAYPSINQLRHMVDQMKRWNLTTMEFYGTVKLHGTHADVLQPHATSTDLIYQSRNRVLSLESAKTDNQGFMQSMVKKDLSQLFASIRARVPGSEGEVVLLAGEWCGGNIQSGVALTGLAKFFVIFDIKVGNRWVDFRQFSDIHDNSQRIYNVMQFPTWTIEFDINNPEAVQEQIINWTQEVAAECPAGRFLGANGEGEGIVWKPVAGARINNSRLWFKTKGEKHSVRQVAKPKDIAPLSVEMVESIQKFVKQVVVENRCKQGITYMKEVCNGSIVIGCFLQWMVKDITKEEGDTIAQHGWNIKEVEKQVRAAATEWFKKQTGQ